MVRHDHKPIDKEKVSFLYEVQCLNSDSCAGRIRKNFLSLIEICRYEHQVLILFRMSLEHEVILSKPRVDTRSRCSLLIFED